MAIPILANHTDYITRLRAGGHPEPSVQVAPAVPDLKEGHLDALAAQLRDIRRDYARSGSNPIESDAQVAELLHETLRLDARTAAEKRFWALLSAVKAPAFVEWRWGKADSDEFPPANRYNGGWKDTFRRLWYRAELSKGANPDDPWCYLAAGGEDLWVGIIEREFCQYRGFVHAFLRWWLGPTGDRERSMDEHRRFFIAVRLLQPYRAFGGLAEGEFVSLFEEAQRLSNTDWVRGISD